MAAQRGDMSIETGIPLREAPAGRHIHSRIVDRSEEFSLNLTYTLEFLRLFKV